MGERALWFESCEDLAPYGNECNARRRPRAEPTVGRPRSAADRGCATQSWALDNDRKPERCGHPRSACSPAERGGQRGRFGHDASRSDSAEVVRCSAPRSSRARNTSYVPFNPAPMGTGRSCPASRAPVRRAGPSGRGRQGLVKTERHGLQLVIVGWKQPHERIAGREAFASFRVLLAVALGYANAIGRPLDADHVAQKGEAVLGRPERVEVRRRQPSEAHYVEALAGGQQHVARDPVPRQRVDDAAVVREALLVKRAGRTGWTFLLRDQAGERVGSIEQMPRRVGLASRHESDINNHWPAPAIPDSTRRMKPANRLLPPPRRRLRTSSRNFIGSIRLRPNGVALLSLLPDTVRNRRCIAYQALARGCSIWVGQKGANDRF